MSDTYDLARFDRSQDGVHEQALAEITTGRGLPGDPEDLQSRYIEAVVNGVVVCCLYLPNGNPAPGPKFDYKLKWFERLILRGQELIASGAPVVMAEIGRASCRERVL